MNVVLSILSVLGWTLLVLLILILVILLIVLFSPFRYELEVNSDETIAAKAKIMWLLRILRVRVVYEDDLLFLEVKIIFFSKNFTFELKKVEEEAEEQAEEVAEQVAEEITCEESGARTEEAPYKENTEQTAEETQTEETVEEKNTESIISKIKGIINRIKELYPKIKKIVTDKQNHAAVLHIKNELVYLVKLFIPKKSKVDAVFSAGSPDKTGQTYGAIACLPVIYRDNWKLLPDFEAEGAGFWGYLWFSGRMCVAQIVGVLLRIVFDKNCRRMFTMIMKFVKSIKQKPSQEDK